MTLERRRAAAWMGAAIFTLLTAAAPAAAQDGAAGGEGDPPPDDTTKPSGTEPGEDDTTKDTTKPSTGKRQDRPTLELEPEQLAQPTDSIVVNPNTNPPQEVIDAVTAGEAEARTKESFIFGTYGRVSVGSDLYGGTAQQIRVIAHPPRLLEGPYAELDFGYLHDVGATGTRLFTRSTLALAGDLFHLDGDFDATLAVRNLYVEAQDVGRAGLSFWVGSRMYRGDDIYLLDFWPLDEQNTVGGGGGFAWSKDGNVKLHVGLNRLDDPYQAQFIQVPGEEFGARDVLFLDRQRVVSTLRGEQHLTLSGDTRLKGVLYGEVHALPAGTRRNEDDTEEELPSDSGLMLGAEAGVYGFGKNSYVNVMGRYGSGLAAFDELAIPGDLANDLTADGAQELLFGLSANVEPGPVGVLVGAYLRNFVDADPVVFDPDDVWELGAAVRPAWFITRHIHLIGEVNVQYQRPNGLFPETQQQEIPLVWQLALMPSISLDAASYARPQLRLLYAISLLNESTLLRFAPEDVRRDRPTQHFLGVSVEWWFNSSRG